MEIIFCCREHDQCKHTILSFHSQFGVFNTNIFTMSHCDCDNKFRSCLKEANDSIANVVGYTFFNLLKMHCFEFSHRLQCIERNCTIIKWEKCRSFLPNAQLLSRVSRDVQSQIKSGCCMCSCHHISHLFLVSFCPSRTPTVLCLPEGGV
uniref:Phospholipase A2 group III n=1 Tax=Stegastes partitus TaxID=144197 RepID=A0A3B5A6S8_9TELE